MKTIVRMLSVVMFMVVFMAAGTAQTKNLLTTEVKVYGNCGMCKKTIEKAGNIKGVATTTWNVKTDMATITIDTTKTSVDEVLKRIAAVGYDSDKYRAPDSVYNKLHGCCQYDRPAKGVN